MTQVLGLPHKLSRDAELSRYWILGKVGTEGRIEVVSGQENTGLGHGMYFLNTEQGHPI